MLDKISMRLCISDAQPDMENVMKDHDCSATLSLKIGNPDLEFEGFETSDPKLSGRQIAELFGAAPASEHLVFELDELSHPHEISLKEPAQIKTTGDSRFIVFKSTVSYRFSVDECIYEWGDKSISGPVLDALFVPEGSNDRVWISHRDRPDELVGNGKIDLSDDGLERFYLKEQEWLLNVQGVEVISNAPRIRVADALTKAGFDANGGWIAVLKVRGQPKKPINLQDEIDLTTPGIEKLRLTPKEIKNGDMVSSRRDFSILEGDKQFLQERGFAWETVVDSGRRWFILRDYAPPDGYVQDSVDVAVEIPTGYPTAQLDMFYCHPHLQRADGSRIPTTEARQTIQAKSYQRWSRHRGATNPWNPAFDSLVSQIILAEEAILREVSQ